MMRRHGRIVADDWYFNRAVYNVMLGVHADWSGADVSRKPEYWQNSALKRLNKWRKRGGSRSSFVKRELVRYPSAPDVRLLMNLAEVDSEKDMASIHKRLLRHYRANATAIESFAVARSSIERQQSLERAEAARWTTEPLLVGMRQNLVAMSALDEPVQS
jgi:hypothetical protein